MESKNARFRTTNAATSNVNMNEEELTQTVDPDKCQVRRGDRSPSYRPPLLTRILRFLWRFQLVIAIVILLLVILVCLLIIRLLYSLIKFIVRRISNTVKHPKPSYDAPLPSIRGSGTSFADRRCHVKRKRRICTWSHKPTKHCVCVYRKRKRKCY